MAKATNRILWTSVCGVCLLAAASAALAQRSGNLFRGNWKGTLSPDVLIGIPAEHVERLSEPVQFEIRVFNRGRAELYFITDNVEWEFNGRDAQITEIGSNGAISVRYPGAVDQSQNALSFNMTKIDDDHLLVDWSLISTRAELRFDGLDATAYAGSDQLELD